jgi:hypothetical protein
VLDRLEVERDHLVGAQVAEVAFALLDPELFAAAVVGVLRVVAGLVAEPGAVLDAYVVEVSAGSRPAASPIVALPQRRRPSAVR